jgi:hypothetical protein
MWAIVLVTNIAGTIVFGTVATMVKAMLAGWMIALLVWCCRAQG